MRAVPRQIIAAMRARSCRIAIMAEIDHPAGYVRAWTGIGTLQFGGHDWVGIGALGGVQGLQAASDIQIVDHAYILTNIPPDYEEFVNAKVKGRRASAYIAFLDDANKVIVEPLLIGRTTLDTNTLQVSESGSINLVIRGQSDLWQLEKPLNIALTSEEQKRRFPGDTGFDYITKLTVQRIAWTRV